MATKNISLDIRIILFPIAFLLLYQFIGSVLGPFIANFNSLISLCSVPSFLICYILFRKIESKIRVSTRQLFLSLVLVGLATFVFILRINWGIFDFICPTGILGITHQISLGKFPATYPSFPEVTMNYHQGFLFVAGTFSYLFGAQAALVLKITFIFSFILLAISLMSLSLFHQSKFYLLPLILFIFISSISPHYFIDLGFFNYINGFEYLISNSWPLGLLGIILIVLISSINSQNSVLNPVILFFVLSLSTVNATVFSLLIITMGLLIAWNTQKCTSKKDLMEPIFYLLSLCIIYFIPKHLPSAFLMGENYQLVQAKLKWTELGLAKYINSTAQYLLLSNPITFIGLFIGLRSLKRNANQVEIFLSFFLLVSFFFPMIIYIPNIQAWDNIHKFAILNIFLSILLIGFQLKSENKYQKFILAGTIFSLVCSIPADIDLFLNRSSTQFHHLIKPNDFSKDIITYLNQEKDKKILYGFRHDFDQKCNEDGFSSIAQYAGINYANGYFPEVFLLSSKLEKRYVESNDWWSVNSVFFRQIKDLKSGDFIIMKNTDRVKFIDKLRSSNIAILPKQFVVFENFSLFKSVN